MSWGYSGANGPESWMRNFKGPGVSGNKQSPINIDGADTGCGTLKPLNTSYGTAEVTIENIGWTVKALCSGDNSISSGPLSGNYKLDSFHVHWGAKGTEGSEHQSNGTSFTAELHIVHFNSKYADYAAAATKDDGLAIIAVYLQSGDTNPAFAGVCSRMGQISSKGTSTAAGSVDMNTLLPANRKYHSYDGSLTTPPLSEVCKWVVMDEPISISEEQLAALRTMKDGSGTALTANHRQVQLKGSRQISCC